MPNSLEAHIVYQPVVELATNRVSGIQVRVARPTAASQSDPVYACQAWRDELGSIETDTRVLRAACGQFVQWKAFDFDGGLRVPVSLAFLESERVGEIVRCALSDFGVPARTLELGLESERHLAAHARAPEQVMALAKDGVFFGLVGFGRGYASLSYLARMPFRRGELPRLHLDTEAGMSALHLMHTEIRLLQNLRMRTTAVDVASAAERQLLIGMGCDEARGPFFYGVMDAAEMRQWSRGGRASST